MNVINVTFTGNLVADAAYKKIENSDRSPINFAVAVNERENETIFLSVSYWVKTEDKPKILDFLKKGQKIAVSSDYIKEEKYATKADDGTITKHAKFSFVASRIDLCGTAREI